MTERRVVITGVGLVSPLGLNAKDTWTGLLEGRCGIGPIQAFDPARFACKLAGEVGPYKIREHVPKSYRKATKLMCRDIELAIMASNEAIADAGLVTKMTDESNVTVAPERMAVTFGAGMISCELPEIAPCVAMSVTDGEFDIHKWGEVGMENLTPIWLLKYLPNMLACHVGIIHDIRGPSNSITCCEASGQMAIGEAAQIIQRGDADVALAGGAEARVNPILMMRPILLERANTQSNDDAEHAHRAFAADAAGGVFGEAAAVLTLEELESAKRRGARIYAEVVGTASSNSLNPRLQRLEPDGRGVEIAIRKAMREAQAEPEQIDLIMPHGTAVPEDDRAEAAAIARALGDAVGKAAAWPVKNQLSNTGAGAGTLDAGLATIAMAEGKVGGAANSVNKFDGCPLRFTPEPQERSIRHALCCSYTYGGHTAAVVLRQWQE